ncbi:MAG TPA: FKBP-type peptidyl-prolyl cis-trans isomerase [Longimicrobiales bacterium]|nr:FKBP-type peptidyl-prolyl cis-trans isomerase [Longimicrobiales bacterium]
MRCIPQSAGAEAAGATVAPARAAIRRVGAVVAMVAAANAVGCGGDAVEHDPVPAMVDEPAPDIRTIGYAPELGIKPDSMSATPEGILLQDVRAGRGAEAGPGMSVAVEYRGWLPDGTLFEQRPSPDGFGASEFVVGENPPVAGFDDVVTGMRPGGVRRAVLPPEHGYGLVGRPAGVPAGSVLVFEVRLLRVVR